MTLLAILSQLAGLGVACLLVATLLARQINPTEWLNSGHADPHWYSDWARTFDAKGHPKSMMGRPAVSVWVPGGAVHIDAHDWSPRGVK